MSTVFQIKAIRPRKLKANAIRLELLNALRGEGNAIRKEYQKTVATWRNRPEFAVAQSIEKDKVAVLVGPQGPHAQQYRYVDEGTRPHVIRPRRRPFLRFQTGYRAKTRPGVIGSSRGGANGDIVYTQRPVRHPGTEARRFSEIIQKQRRRPFQRAMVDAIQRGNKKLHGN